MCAMAKNNNSTWDVMTYIIGVILHEGGVEWGKEAKDLARKMNSVGLVGLKSLSNSTHNGVYINKIHPSTPEYRWSRRHIESCPDCQRKYHLIKQGILYIRFYPKTRRFTELYFKRLYGYPEFSNALKRMEARLKQSQKKNKVQEVKPVRIPCTFFAQQIETLTPEEAIAETKIHINGNGKKRVCFHCADALQKYIAKHGEAAAA